MGRIIFSKEAEKYHKYGLAFRAYGEKLGTDYGFLDSLYHRSDVKNIIKYKFKHLAKELFPELDEWVFDTNNETQKYFDNAFHVGLFGGKILTRDKVGKTMKIARKKRNLTQDGLGKKCNKTQSFIADAENGKRNLTFETVTEILNSMNFNLDYILNDLDFSNDT